MSNWRGGRAAGRQTGKGVAIPAVAAGANTNIAVVFPVEYATPPVVKVQVIGTSRLTDGIVAGSLTTTGFTINFGNWSGGSVGATTFDWIAEPA